MKRETILKGFAILMIAGFVIEIVMIALPGQGGFPETIVTPTATAVPQTEFTGSALANATIQQMAQRLLARCNTTESVSQELRNVPNVTNAVQDQRSQLIDISLSENASIPGTLEMLRETLSPYCDPFFLQQAFVTFPGDVTFAPFANGTQNRTFSGKTLACEKNSAYCFVFVLPSHRVGDIAVLDVAGRFVGSVASRLFGQEQIDAGFEIRSVAAEARVSFLENRGQAEATLPWENRNVNLTRLYGELFERAEFQDETDYRPASYVNVSGNLGNETLEQLKNLSFVMDLSYDNESTYLFVADNLTNRSEVLQALQRLEINGSRVSFPTSGFGIIVIYRDLNQTVRFLESRLDAPVGFQRFAYVRFLDPGKVAGDLRALWKDKDEAFPVLVSLSVNSTAQLNVTVTAAVQYGEVTEAIVRLAE